MKRNNCMHLLCVTATVSEKYKSIYKEIEVVQKENTAILINRQNFQQMNEEHKLTFTTFAF